MNNSKGWVKLHREIIDHWVFQNAEYFLIWSYLLMNANYRKNMALTSKGLTKIAVGELVTSRDTISKITHVGVQSVRTCFKLLEKDGMIILKTSKKGTHITICNYKAYQDIQPTTNQQLTNSQPTANQQLTTPKKERKKERKNFKEEEGACTPTKSSGTAIVPLPPIEANDQPKKESLRAARFVPPTTSEAEQYFDELSAVLGEANRFHDYYQSNGWMVGRNRMKDWRATARNWLRRNQGSSTQPRPKTTQGDRYGGMRQSEYVRMVDLATRPDNEIKQLPEAKNGTDSSHIGGE